jgi:hypothetical protein
MATIFPQPINTAPGNNCQIITWKTFKFGDNCLPILSVDMADRSIQIEGTFSASTVVTMQGSNDATSTTGGNYHQLHDLSNTAISVTAAALIQIEEIAVFMKPVITNGDGNESITVTMLSKQAH